MKIKEPNTFLFRGNKRTLYFMTLFAFLALGAAAYLTLPTFNGGAVSAQRSEQQPNLSVGTRSKGEQATAQMISYALSNRTNNLSDTISALNQLPCHEIADTDLSGKSFGPGVYCLSSARLAGEMVLNGDENAIFIFNVAGALDTMENSKISLAGDVRASNVFFVPGTANVGAGSDFRGAILAKNAVFLNNNARVAGRLSSLSGEVAGATNDSPDGGGSGTLEICKRVSSTFGNLENRIFQFRITGANIPTPIVRSVRAGFCTAPFDVPNGAATVTELNEGFNLNGEPTSGNFALTGVRVIQASTPSPSTLGTVNLAARTAAIMVNNSGINDQLTLEFTNRFAITGFVEICKRALDLDVTGTFTFTIEGVFAAGSNTTLQTFTAPVGQCTGAIAVTRPFDGPGGLPGPREAAVRVTELGRIDSFLVSANTIPADREIGQEVLGLGVNAAGGTFTNSGGGFITVRVLEGDESRETIIEFFNRSRPGLLKVCKIAGPGVNLNRIFSFTVTGTGPTTAAGTTTGTVTRTFDVAAGSAADGGTCAFVPGFGAGAGSAEFQTFVIGTNITITENPEIVNNGQIRVSRVRSTSAATRPSEFVVVTAARQDVVEVEFTNFLFRPTILKICKIAGSAALLDQPFTFTTTFVSPMGIGGALFPSFTTTTTVNAGPNNNGQGGNCNIVSGTGTGTLIGGAFNQGSTVIISENAAPGTIVSGITSTTSVIAPFVAGVRATTLTGDDGLVEGVTQVTFTNTAVTTTPSPSPSPANRAAAYDFDGDSKADLSVFRPSNGTWYVNRSRDGFMGMAFGQNGDRIVPADYDGDGRTDQAVFRSGTWYVMGSTAGFSGVAFGNADDIPMPADYDGDGRADIAVFRPSTGTWYLLRSTAGFAGVNFGQTGDRPVAADYDGDNKADIAVYRSGTWYVMGSTAGFSGTAFGEANDRPVAADYDGDGRADIAVFRASTGTWYLLRSTAGFTGVAFGMSSDIPSPADYDGDGKANIAVFRSSNGTWYINSSTDAGTVQFGANLDEAVPSAFVR